MNNNLIPIFALMNVFDNITTNLLDNTDMIEFSLFKLTLQFSFNYNNTHIICYILEYTVKIFG